MTICAPNPFGCCGGSRLLKGGYSYWPLWWYGQRDELPDMSGHGVTLYPSGAYFDGQGYYFDGNDYLIDDDGRKVLQNGTVGSWHSVYLTEGEVPAKGSIWGTGTKLWLNTSGAAPKITGKIVLRSAYCPNLEELRCYGNCISTLKVSGLTSLTYLNCNGNYLTTLDVDGAISLTTLSCRYNYNLPALDVSTLTALTSLECRFCKIHVLDISALTLLTYLSCYNNQISILDASALTLLETFYCYNNNITDLDVNGAISLKTLKCYNNNMEQDMVDTVLCAMDGNGEENGYLDISGNEAPSATGVTCKNNLVARGWSVTTD